MTKVLKLREVLTDSFHNVEFLNDIIEIFFNKNMFIAKMWRFSLYFWTWPWPDTQNTNQSNLATENIITIRFFFRELFYSSEKNWENLNFSSPDICSICLCEVEKDKLREKCWF